MVMKSVSSWGRLLAPVHDVQPLLDRQQVPQILMQRRGLGLAYGNGRSYGDVAFNPGGTLWTTIGLSRFIHFDSATGELECESGVLLQDIQQFAVAHGWMLPVTPGTWFVTVGGAIANDVHGKNHHRFGTFGDHIRSITLARTDGSVIECGPGNNESWWRATCGGLGLTGVIVSACLQLRPVKGPWLITETQPYQGLDEFFDLSDRSESEWEYTVSWIDCLYGKEGRGLFMRGNHCATSTDYEPPIRKWTMPVVPPVSLVNHYSLRAFNALYFNLKKQVRAPQCVHYRPFFYPLDGILNWNRIYGPHGFYQYQCVVPRNVGKEAMTEMLKTIKQAGSGSFLAVIKTFGERKPVGMLSFPQPGVTLAIDFPNQRERTRHLFERLDAIVEEAGGRLYMAKDAMMSARLFREGYPDVEAFLPYRDPGISSAMARRLLSDQSERKV